MTDVPEQFSFGEISSEKMRHFALPEYELQIFRANAGAGST
jgi:hypothetical protein